jgi:hypothetical protein
VRSSWFKQRTERPRIIGAISPKTGPEIIGKPAQARAPQSLDLISYRSFSFLLIPPPDAHHQQATRPDSKVDSPDRDRRQPPPPTSGSSLLAHSSPSTPTHARAGMSEPGPSFPKFVLMPPACKFPPLTRFFNYSAPLPNSVYGIPFSSLNSLF